MAEQLAPARARFNHAGAPAAAAAEGVGGGAITAVHRWAVTGTPLAWPASTSRVGSLENLQRLLLLSGSRLAEMRWFKRLVREPAEHGGAGGIAVAKAQLQRVMCRHNRAQREGDGRPILVLPAKYESVLLVRPITRLTHLPTRLPHSTHSPIRHSLDSFLLTHFTHALTSLTHLTHFPKNTPTRLTSLTHSSSSP